VAIVLEDRIRIQVEIALASDGCADTRAAQECRARAAGLTGAEIDAARSGRCFDRRADAAVRLARTLRATATTHGPALAARARRAGLSDAEIDAICAMAGDPTTEMEQPT
jgi:hypothetical protein